MFGTVEDYREESEIFVRYLRDNIEGSLSTLLDLGCGGGKNAFHFRRHCALTGVDISPAMLAQAQELNPPSRFVEGDMRSVDLREEFDAVFLNDSSMYMTTRDELMQLFRTAYRHLRPGGAALVTAEVTSESFVHNGCEVSNYSDDRGREVCIIEQDYRKSPDAEQFDLTFVFLIREHGRQRIENDVHTCGLFPLDFWREAPQTLGFSVREMLLETEGVVMPILVYCKPPL